MIKQSTASPGKRKRRNTPQPAARPKANSTGKAARVEVAAPAKAPSKLKQIIQLLVGDEGATLDQMIAVTGWLPHTTRAALTGLKKKGYALCSDKFEGVRTYRAVAPE